MDSLPPHMRPERSFQGLILTLQVGQNRFSRKGAAHRIEVRPDDVRHTKRFIEGPTDYRSAAPFFEFAIGPNGSRIGIENGDAIA